MKKIIVSLLMLLPLGLVAQDLKIAVVNTNEILATMPEAIEMQRQLQSIAAQYQEEFKTLEEDFNRKYNDFMAQGDTLNENIRMRRLQDVQEMQAKLENFYPSAQEELAKKQEELLTPIRTKVQKAISEVGEEGSYTYILDPQTIHYIGNSAVEVTEKVKAKLGIK